MAVINVFENCNKRWYFSSSTIWVWQWGRLLKGLDAWDQSSRKRWKFYCNDLFENSKSEAADLGHVKGWHGLDCIKGYPREIREVAEVLCCLLISQCSVERLFSGLHFIFSHLKGHMNNELCESLLFLRFNLDKWLLLTSLWRQYFVYFNSTCFLIPGVVQGLRSKARSGARWLALSLGVERPAYLSFPPGFAWHISECIDENTEAVPPSLAARCRWRRDIARLNSLSSFMVVVSQVFNLRMTEKERSHLTVPIERTLPCWAKLYKYAFAYL